MPRLRHSAHLGRTFGCHGRLWASHPARWLSRSWTCRRCQPLRQYLGQPPSIHQRLRRLLFRMGRRCTTTSWWRRLQRPSAGLHTVARRLSSAHHVKRERGSLHVQRYIDVGLTSIWWRIRGRYVREKAVEGVVCCASRSATWPVGGQRWSGVSRETHTHSSLTCHFVGRSDAFNPPPLSFRFAFWHSRSCSVALTFLFLALSFLLFVFSTQSIFTHGFW